MENRVAYVTVRNTFAGTLRETDKVKIWGNLNGLNDIAKVFRSPQGYTTVVKTSHLPPLTLDEA